MKEFARLEHEGAVYQITSSEFARKIRRNMPLGWMGCRKRTDWNGRVRTVLCIMRDRDLVVVGWELE